MAAGQEIWLSSRRPASTGSQVGQLIGSRIFERLRASQRPVTSPLNEDGAHRVGYIVHHSDSRGNAEQLTCTPLATSVAGLPQHSGRRGLPSSQGEYGFNLVVPPTRASTEHSHGLLLAGNEPDSDSNQQDISDAVGEYGVNGCMVQGQTDNEKAAQGIDNEHKKAEHYKTLLDVDMRQIKDNNRALKHIFDIVTRDGRFNHRGARLPLSSCMNIARWKSMLRGYQDAHIAEYLEFGWPIGVNSAAQFLSEGNNHPSATAHKEDVDHYIATELSHNALLGPFEGPPATGCHYSPLMTRIKKGSKF